MNIVFLSREFPPTHNGGVGIYTYEMSRLLAKHGHRVYVVTEAIETPLRYQHEDVTIVRILPERSRIFDRIRKYVPGFIDRLEYSRAVSSALKIILSSGPVDIVESCEARAEGFLFYLLRNKPRLVIKLHTPEGIVYKLNREPLYRDRHYVEKLEGWWLHKARTLVGLSNAIVSLSCAHYGLRTDGIRIVPNPIDSRTFSPAPVSSSASAPLVLYVGRLEFRKGCHVLIRSIPAVLHAVPDARFLFVGNDCGMSDYLTRQASVLGISGRVDFIGYRPREELAGYYNRCAVCCVPSLWENQPYTCLEAMACGRPVVASSTGGIPEIIENGVNGLLVPAGSVVRLAEAIIRLLEDRKLADSVGENARKTIEMRYDPESVMKRTLKIYERVLK